MQLATAVRHEAPWGSTPVRLARRAIVRLHAPGTHNGHAARRAEAMARVLDSEVVILKLSAGLLPSISVLFPHRHHDEAVAAATHQAREEAVLQRWRARRERRGVRGLEAAARPATIHAIVNELAAKEARLVVVPAGLAWRSGTIVELAVEARVPVLVARAARPHERLVAATNLEHERLPVVAQAAGLASRLDGALTVVHNTPPLAMTTLAWGVEASVPLVSEVADSVVRAKEAQLFEATRRVSRDATARVTTHFDPLVGILETSAREDADLIVAGVHARWSLGSQRVTERLVAEADRSVLLVPIDE